VTKPRFRTRLFATLALFAFVPAIVLTLAWSALAARMLPQMSGAAAWEQIAESGSRAARLARETPGSEGAQRALREHEALLGESRVQARRFSYLSQRAAVLFLVVGLFITVAVSFIASRVAGHLSRQLSRPLLELVGWTERIAKGERLPLPQLSESRGAPEFEVLRDRMRQMEADLETGRRSAIEAERLSAFRESARQVAHELKNPLTPIRFASGRGHVITRVSVRNDEVTLAVRDNGIGIAAAAVDRIWEPYVTAKTGGTGLGLAIVKQTVLAHGGRVSATSAPGEGTEIRMHFPALLAERAGAQTTQPRGGSA
jgi:nitrogen fixation/metabolism regulation signal transduction histidine kinase